MLKPGDWDLFNLFTSFSCAFLVFKGPIQKLRHQNGVNYEEKDVGKPQNLLKILKDFLRTTPNKPHFIGLTLVGGIYDWPLIERKSWGFNYGIKCKPRGACHETKKNVISEIKIVPFWSWLKTWKLEECLETFNIWNSSPPVSMSFTS